MHLRNAKYLGLPQINSRWSPFPLHWLHSYPVFYRIQYKWLDFLEETTEILWDTRLKCIWIFISAQQLEDNSMYHILSQDESCFPVFDWRGEPVFHKHLKWSFPSSIGRWEGLCVSVSSGMYRERTDSKEGRISLQWLKFGLVFQVTRWRDVWIPCGDPRESQSSPPHLDRGNHITLIPQEAHGIQGI